MTDSISNAIWRAYGREAVSMPDVMAEVQKVAGSGRKAAKMVGVGETTWRRWRAGQTRPRPENFARLEWAFRGVRADNVPLNAQTLVIHTTDIDQPSRNRKIHGRQLRLDQTRLSAVTDAYRRGDRTGAARAFLAAIRESWYRGYLSAAGPDPDPQDEYGGTVDRMEI